MAASVKERLEQLRDNTDADSMSEVVRKALAVYELVTHEVLRGSTLIIKSSDGSERRVEII